MPEQNTTPPSPQDPPLAPEEVTRKGGDGTTVDPTTAKLPDGAMGLGDDEEES